MFSFDFFCHPEQSEGSQLIYNYTQAIGGTLR